MFWALEDMNVGGEYFTHEQGGERGGLKAARDIPIFSARASSSFTCFPAASVGIRKVEQNRRARSSQRRSGEENV